MQARQYFTAFLITPILVALTERVGWTFSITFKPMPNGVYNSEVKYYNGQGQGVVNAVNMEQLLPPIDDPTDSKDFISILKNTFSSGWQFNTANNELSGSFNIENYYACGPQTLCGVQANAAFPGIIGTGGIGAFLDVTYNPVGRDPTPVANSIYWVQRIINNHNIAGGYGSLTDGLDIAPGQSDPYYPGTAGENFFIDRSYRPNPQDDHYWFAELYLVEETAPKTVTIYNGIKWGWTNTFTPAKTSKTFSGNLSSGTQVDKYKLSDLAPGSKYRAWTNNDLPSNRCNPNTFLSTHNDSGFRLGFDDNSSSVGNGFASGLTGTVGSSGNINLNVRAAGGGARGQDRGNYELFVDVIDRTISSVEIRLSNSE